MYGFLLKEKKSGSLVLFVYIDFNIIYYFLYCIKDLVE